LQKGIYVFIRGLSRKSDNSGIISFFLTTSRTAYHKNGKKSLKKAKCPGRDLNPHGVSHTPLKRTCLPGSTTRAIDAMQREIILKGSVTVNELNLCFLVISKKISQSYPQGIYNLWKSWKIVRKRRTGSKAAGFFAKKQISGLK
jgi:hypothetical protein